VILYELLTGRRPFGGAGTRGVYEQVLTAAPPRPRALRPDLPAGLERVALKCLEKDPQQRYPSAAALADDLRRWLDGQPVRARPEGPLRRGLRLLVRQPAGAAAAALAVTAAAAAAAAFLAPAPPRPPADDPDPLKAAARRLAVGEPAELIGADGLPPARRPLEGSVDFVPCSREDPVALLAPEGNRGQVELLPDPQGDAYHFRADVRPEQPAADAGLYFLHGATPDDRGTRHAFLVLTVRDRGKAGFHLALNARCWVHRAYDDAARLWEGDEPADGVAWHTLAAEVRPKLIRVFWGDKAVADVSPADLSNAARRLALSRDDPKLAPPVFSPREGLGLYSVGGAASFCRAVVQPLK
jgi:hypothetical protein